MRQDRRFSRCNSYPSIHVLRRALALTVLLATTLLAVGSSPGMAAPPGFVGRSGTNLELDGQPYRFSGINIYNANNLSGCWYAMGSGSTLDDSLSAISSTGGPKVMRAWFFQALATDGGARDWSAIDNTLAVAAAHGTRVIATLGNQWSDCDGPGGGAGSYKDHAWYTGGYTEPDPAGTGSYRDWVAEIVDRYKNDPTILAWQLLNEAEVKPSEGSSCSPDAAVTLKDFADDVSGLIKSIDANHLVSLGTMGGGQCGAQGAEYQDVHDLATIDLCEYHDYGSPTTLMPGDQWNGLQVRVDQCNALDKPLFVGETGIRQEDLPTLQSRANAFRAKFGAQFLAGVDGELVWAWNKDGSAGSYDIGPGDPVLALLDEFKDGPPESTTAPVVTITLAPAASDGSNGWYVSPVGVTVSADDGSGSGVAETRCVLDPASPPGNFDDLPASCAVTSVGADGTHVVYAASKDNDGNTSAVVNSSFKIDQTDPTVICGVAAPGPVFVLQGAGGNISAAVSDTTSGAVSGSVSAAANVATVGNRTVTLIGSDNAGNTTTVNCPYRVKFNFLGFTSPKAQSSNKAGSAIQVKFMLANAAGVKLSDAAAQALVSPTCRVRITLDGTEQAGCASYNATSDTFEYTLKTSKSLAAGSHALAIKVSAPDGSGVVNTDGTTIMIK